MFGLLEEVVEAQNGDIIDPSMGWILPVKCDEVDLLSQAYHFLSPLQYGVKNGSYGVKILMVVLFKRD